MKMILMRFSLSIEKSVKSVVFLLNLILWLVISEAYLNNRYLTKCGVRHIHVSAYINKEA